MMPGMLRFGNSWPISVQHESCDHYIPNVTSRCPDRKTLSEAIAGSVVSGLRAKKSYNAAKPKRAANVAELLTALATARKTEPDATHALNGHVKHHDCLR